MAATSTTTGPKTLLGDRYEVLSALGSGSAAHVFRVRDTRGGAEHAAKVLKSAHAANPEILARFEDEYRILKSMRHPHLPEVHDFGFTDEGGRYLVMDLVEGDALDAYFAAHPQDIWVLLYELCETLGFIHAHNLLHQDIKPGNILVRRSRAFGRDLPLITLIDFGLTYRRDAGASVKLVGTPAYVAPEVVRGEAPLTRAVDYYSLGVTLYELLCGAPPFAGTTAEMLRAHLAREPVIEEERLEWAELYPHVRALLNKDRRARLEAFEELRRAVVSRLTGGIDELARAYDAARAPLREPGAATKVRAIPGLQEAQELELAGETRQALRAYLRLLNTCNRRDLESIENICINAMRAAKAKRKFRLISRYFLKRRVEALWARNMYIVAHRAIHEWAGRDVDRVPSSLLPRYARGVMYLQGAHAARDLIAGRLASDARLNGVSKARLSLDLALFMYHSGEFSGARKMLRVARAGKARLTCSDQVRITLYEVMLMTASGNARKAAQLAAAKYPDAVAQGCNDEALMLLWHCAYDANQWAEHDHLHALLQEGLLKSHRLGLHLREAEFRALARIAYSFRDDFVRAIRYELTVVHLYQRLGMLANAAHSWIAIAMICQGMGRFGDALRYVKRSRHGIRQSHSELHRMKALLFDLDMRLMMNAPALDRSFDQVEPMIGRDSEKGYFYLLRGEYELGAGRLDDARGSFGAAQKAFERAGEKDDVLRAAIMIVRIDAAHGSRTGVNEKVRLIERRLEAVDAVAVWAEYRLLKLELTYLRRTSRDRLLEAAAQCWSTLPGVAYVPIRFRVLRQLARAYARVGDADMFDRVMGAFQDLLRVAVANMDAGDEVRRFLEGVGLPELMRMSESRSRNDPAETTEGVAN